MVPQVDGDNVKVVVFPSILLHIIAIPIDSIFQMSPPYLAIKDCLYCILHLPIDKLWQGEELPYSQ
jgi:hypothetical protein